MISRIAVFESHEKAIEAITNLKDAGFPIDKISLIGEAQIINDHMYLKSLEPLKNLPIAVGLVTGAVTGLLSGMGIFMIPGFGFLFGAGAIVGALGGLDLGLVVGGVATILVQLGVKKEDVIKYEEHIKAGRFLFVFIGKKKKNERV
jgi:uncharacterized membrane protein